MYQHDDGLHFGLVHPSHGKPYVIRSKTPDPMQCPKVTKFLKATKHHSHLYLLTKDCRQAELLCQNPEAGIPAPLKATLDSDTIKNCQAAVRKLVLTSP